MTPLITKVFSGIIVCSGLMLALNVWLFNPEPTIAFGLIPFQGYPVHIEYNCLCSGSIMVTVHPKPTNVGPQQDINLLYVWAADLLSNYIDLGAFSGLVPHAYLWCGVFWEGDQILLGNYVPGSFPCYQYIGTGCSLLSNAQGAILNVGSSLY